MYMEGRDWACLLSLAVRLRMSGPDTVRLGAEHGYFQRPFLAPMPNQRP